jgi:hypothetical protein
MLELDQFCSPHRGEHRVSAGLGLAIKKDLELNPLAFLTHVLQSSSASRLTASHARFLLLSQSGDPSLAQPPCLPTDRGGDRPRSAFRAGRRHRENVLIVPTVPEPIKVRHAALVAGHRLAMPNANADAGLVLFRFRCDLNITARATFWS